MTILPGGRVFGPSQVAAELGQDQDGFCECTRFGGFAREAIENSHLLQGERCFGCPRGGSGEVAGEDDLIIDAHCQRSDRPL